MDQDLELRQLQQTIVALREELEKSRMDERDHVQQAVAAANAQIRQLREAVVELRGRLELKESEFQDRLRDVELHYDRERTELHKTVAKLRETLEDLNESVKKDRAPSKATAAGPPR